MGAIILKTDILSWLVERLIDLVELRTEQGPGPTLTCAAFKKREKYGVIFVPQSTLVIDIPLADGPVGPCYHELHHV